VLPKRYTFDKEAGAAFIFASGWHPACQWLPLLKSAENSKCLIGKRQLVL
jgi:hypothetical protein